ncbi:MAG: methionine--tRNA ligase [Candidatus Lokiarchaeota archaeon]|nr:methionine--tRNA ligase [Candidatus Lokiarchaeota archaeon]
MSDKKFYLTTAIAYLNGSPHMGHALEIIQADCLARFYRLIDDDLVFQTGSDEHGVKIYTTAQEKGIDTQEFIDKYYEEFIHLYNTLNISYDRYCRTTSELHEKGVIKFWKAMQKNGDLEKAQYQGMYCVGCESFKTESELENGRCPFHLNRELIKVEEENYFFKLTRYKEKLLDIYENDIIEIIPRRRKAEIVGILKSELTDISFSRLKTKMPWGFEVPGDEEHVIYVWADALANYITNIGYEYDEHEFNSIWPADIHLIGKDIVKFHAIYWPAMLLSAGIPLFKKLFVHGFITIEGSKIGKSLGNAVDPLVLIKEYGVDPFRYYILKNIPSYDDGSFVEDDLVETYNTSLADDLGNLLLRVLTFLIKDFDHKIPKFISAEEIDQEFIDKFNFVSELKESMDNFQINKVLNRVWEFIKDTNKYINEVEPWVLRKDENKNERYRSVLHILTDAIRVISIYISPFMPSIADKIKDIINYQDECSFKNIDFDPNLSGKVGNKVVLFPKIELKKADPMQIFDFKIGKIIDVHFHPESSKIYVLTVDVGGEERTICAKIAKDYTQEDLMNNTYPVLVNIKSRSILGIESEGMLLGAKDPQTKRTIIAEIKGVAGEQLYIGDLEPKPRVVSGKKFNKTKMKVKKNKIRIRDKYLKSKKKYVQIDLPDGIRIN